MAIKQMRKHRRPGNSSTPGSQQNELTRKQRRKQDRADRKARRQQHQERRCRGTLPAPAGTGPVPRDVPGTGTGKARAKAITAVSPSKARLDSSRATGKSDRYNSTNGGGVVRGGDGGSLRRRVDELARNKARRVEQRVRAEREARCCGLREANSVEERNIKRLETLLCMKRRRRGKSAATKLPASFAHDGLDYILDATDSEKVAEEVRARAGIRLGGLRGSTPSGEASEDSGGQDREESEQSDEESEECDEQPLQSEEEMGQSDEESGESDEEMGQSDDESRESDEESGESEDLNNSEKSKSVNQCNNSDLKKTEDGNCVREEDERKKRTMKKRPVVCDIGTNQSRADGKKRARDKDEAWEDIYGRLRDKSGNVIDQKSGVYVPPALRAKQLGDTELQQKQTSDTTQLRRRLQGLLNRLSASTLRLQLSLAEQLYRQHSRHDVNDILTQLIHECCVSSAAVLSDRILAEHALFIAALHSTIGSEIGGHFLQKTVVRLNLGLGPLTSPPTLNTTATIGTSASSEDTGGHCDSPTSDLTDPQATDDGGDDCRTDKTPDNLVVLLAYLYCFQVMDATLLTDLVRRLADRCSSLDIRLLLLLLRSCGFQLRRREPLKLKQLLQLIQARCSAVLQNTSAVKLHARVRFMLDALLAIKNNNMAKIAGYDPQLVAGLQQLLKTVVKAAAAGADPAANQLSVSLDDLLNAEVSGKWWVVGSAWSSANTAADPSTANSCSDQLEKQHPEFSQQLLQLARKHHMNTELRRNVFCILMSAEDYVDAFERLLSLGVRGVLPSRQLVSVVLHCALHERRYNPFYSLLLERLCRASRRYQLYVRVGLEERLTDCDRLCTSSSSDLESAPAGNTSSPCVSSSGRILTRLVAELIWRGALTVTLLQALDLSQLDAARVSLLRLTLLQLLTSAAAGRDLSSSRDTADKQLAAVFGRSSGAKLRPFRSSLVLFMRHFMSTQQMAPLAHECGDDVTVTSLSQCMDLAVSSLKSCDRGDDDHLF